MDKHTKDQDQDKKDQDQPLVDDDGGAWVAVSRRSRGSGARAASPTPSSASSSSRATTASRASTRRAAAEKEKKRPPRASGSGGGGGGGHRRGEPRTPVSSLVVGDAARGVVKNVVDYGAFVDVGAERDGLLHAREADASGGYIADLRERLRVGDELSVFVRSVDARAGRFALTVRPPMPARRPSPPTTPRPRPRPAPTPVPIAQPFPELKLKPEPEPMACSEEAKAPAPQVGPTAAEVLQGTPLPPPAAPPPASVLTRHVRGRTLVLYELPWKKIAADATAASARWGDED